MHGVSVKGQLLLHMHACMHACMASVRDMRSYLLATSLSLSLSDEQQLYPLA